MSLCCVGPCAHAQLGFVQSCCTGQAAACQHADMKHLTSAEQHHPTVGSVEVSLATFPGTMTLPHSAPASATASLCHIWRWALRISPCSWVAIDRGIAPRSAIVYVNMHKCDHSQHWACGYSPSVLDLASLLERWGVIERRLHRTQLQRSCGCSPVPRLLE